MDEQFLNELIEKYGGNIDTLKAMWVDFEKDANDFGIVEPEQKLNTIKKRYLSYYAKMQRSPTVPVQAVILGITKTDYGAQKMYDEALKKFEEDPNNALAQGYIDNTGTPIYRTPEFKRGEVINPEEATIKQCFGIAKTEKDKDFRLITLNLKGICTKVPVPIGKFINFRSTIIDSKTTAQKYEMTSVQGIDFTIERDCTKEELHGIIGTYFSDGATSINQLKKWHEDRANDFNRLAFVLGDVADITMTDGTKSNLLVINDPDMLTLPDDALKVLTCWVEKEPELEINFDTKAQDVIVVGRTNEKKDTGALSFSVYGIIVADCFKIKDKPKAITPAPTPVQAPQPTVQAPAPQPTAPVTAQKTTQGWA